MCSAATTVGQLGLDDRRWRHSSAFGQRVPPSKDGRRSTPCRVRSPRAGKGRHCRARRRPSMMPGVCPNRVSAGGAGAGMRPWIGRRWMRRLGHGAAATPLRAPRIRPSCLGLALFVFDDAQTRDPCPARPFAHLDEKRFDVRGGAADDRLDRAVAAVAHPTGNAEPQRPATGKLAIAHALDPPFDEHVADERRFLISCSATPDAALSNQRPAVNVLVDTQKQVSQFPVRHCERSEAIQGPQYDRLGCWRRTCCGPWIASSQGLLAMTDGSRLTRSIR